MTGQPSEPPERRRLLWQMREVLIGLLPRQLKEILEKGLLKALAMVILVIVVLPPVIALLAAFWLKELGRFDMAAIRALRNAYLHVVHDGFSIEEVAARRLDYFHPFSANLYPRNAAREFPRELIILVSVQPRQRATIYFRSIDLIADTEKCSLPDTRDLTGLVSIFLGRQLIESDLGKEQSGDKIELDKKRWDETLAKLRPDDPVSRLSFKLTDAAKQQLTCGFVHIEGSIAVFKDLFPPAGG